ncbi:MULTISPECIES: serine hydrolase [unclassified Synechocystis]|uniref:serine hydrolase domain-containing protein n=1 Tax=unclassified Synechocystis TaxID=2640012 RepID=UPI00042949AF|nr:MULTISPECIES: serine hydrolase [unclassified Synechocystis]AIE74279.1 D-alanyl-D-alanine carboxypeptidase [Synechocystis sp. PCC 6714]MCT0254930.1 beta-lactamase family protein [Synechocystis sp. CS-94]
MKKSLFLGGTLAFFSILSTGSAWGESVVDGKVQAILDKHYQTYRNDEFFSAIQLSTKAGDGAIKTYVVGTKSHEADSPVIDSESLFQIGSITKSFTSVLLLQAEMEGKVSLDNDFTSYLPEYGRWNGVTITQLLNMTSGLPNYSDSPTINYSFVQSPERIWQDKELVDVVYPQPNLPAPPLNTGYGYTNTAYTLGGLILEKVYGQSYAELIDEKILQPLQLDNTFYPIPSYPPVILARMVDGNNFNPYTNPELTGRSVDNGNLSWAGAAGGLVANTQDIISWVRALFVEDKLLSLEQKKQLTQIVSLSTGEPITGTTAEEPRGFGLGVVQGYDQDWGHYWFYQGETLGHRSFYLYFPCNEVIISALFNSAVNDQNNNVKPLLTGVYQALLDDQPNLVCQSK